MMNLSVRLLRLDSHKRVSGIPGVVQSVKLSGLSLTEIVTQLKHDYDVEITQSGLSHNINRGALRLQRALQILAVCGVDQVEIKREN